MPKNAGISRDLGGGNNARPGRVAPRLLYLIGPEEPELRAAEPEMTYEALLADLKANGKL